MPKNKDKRHDEEQNSINMKVCPSFENLDAASSFILSPRCLEGLKISINKNFLKTFYPSTTATLNYSCDLGSYPDLKNQNLLLNFLLKPEETGNKHGDADWNTSIRFDNHDSNSSYYIKYSKGLSMLDSRILKPLSTNLSLRAFWLIPNLHAQLKKSFISFNQTVNVEEELQKNSKKFYLPSIINAGYGIFTLEYAKKLYNLALKSSSFDTSSFGLTYTRLLKEKFVQGIEFSFSPEQKILNTNIALKYINNTTEVLGSTSFNMNIDSKNVKEATYFSNFNNRLNVFKVIHDNLSLACELSVPLDNLKKTSLSVGIDSIYHETRMLAALNNALEVSLTAEKPNGLAFNLNIDFLKDNYKFGTSFEVNI